MSEATEKVDPEHMVGRYRLTRRLGRGGFGEVFLGEAEDGSQAAVKLLHASWSGDQDMRRRFAAEVDQARRVSGFCVAEILDADPEAEQPWIASEFIDGPTLQASVEAEGPRFGSDLQRLAVSTATALAAIHAAGVVHRDLKPDNIMLASDGPRVIDFGIARAVEATSVTASGIVGTVGYMAPEQLEGMRIGAPVDVFAWGAVMVFAATGRDAFPGPTQASRIARILSGEPDTEDLDGPFQKTILACLAKDPKARPDAPTLLQHLVAGTAPPGPVAPTKVEARPGAAPTLTYTERVGAREAATPSATTHPGPEPSGPEGGGGVRTRVPARSSDHGSVPPYYFADTRFTNVAELAAAFQWNWAQGLRLFADREEFAALGSWVMQDVGDTRIDRSLFRREVRDVNLALATFIAEANPALPPRFRGHDASIGGLAKLFHDPQPLITGAPAANELVLLARPEVLSVMARHEGEDSARLASLVRDLDTAERAVSAFQQELSEGLAGWPNVSERLNPALVLVFLLHPEKAVVPSMTPNSREWEWVEALWLRVGVSEGTQCASVAAAVYGSVETIEDLAEEYRRWNHALEEQLAQEKSLKKRTNRHNAFVWLTLATLLLSLTSCLWSSNGLGTPLLLIPVALFLVLIVTREARSGDRSELSKLFVRMEEALERLDLMDQDLERARQLCSRPSTG